MDQKLVIHQLRNRTRTRRKQSGSSFENHIMSLQEHFLNPGMHCIDVDNQEQGRRLLRLGLDSLGIHTDVAILTVPPYNLPQGYKDLYAELDAWDALTLDNGMLEEYLLSVFECDFLVLEYTRELIQQTWYGKFEQLLHEYSISKSIPVVIFLYNDQQIDKN